MFVFTSILTLTVKVFGQDVSYKSFGDGINIHAQDSTFHTTIGVRFQTLFTGTRQFETSSWEENLQIRRCRLKFDGYVLNPNIVYKFEFGISNNDIRSGAIEESGQASNIILDAVVKWKFHRNWELWAGQTKLPGNRERVISSQKMQFVDRSMANAMFTLDRDLGIQLHHFFSINRMILKQSFALSKGEGRNIITPNHQSGRQYTGRLEVLPFGMFTHKGDYFGSDLAREKRPKLSLGMSLDFNDNATRSRGNLGEFIRDPATSENYLSTDFQTAILDGVFKYRGLSVSSEYFYRDAVERIEGFGYGQGLFGGLGYMFTTRFELAGRYTQIRPISAMSSIRKTEEYTLGASLYIHDHNFKVQSDLSYRTEELAGGAAVFRIQCELAI